MNVNSIANEVTIFHYFWIWNIHMHMHFQRLSRVWNWKGLCSLWTVLKHPNTSFLYTVQQPLFSPWSSLKMCVGDEFILPCLFPPPFSSQKHLTAFYSEVILLHWQNTCVSSNIKNSNINSGSIFLYGFSLYSHKQLHIKLYSLKGKLRGETSETFSFL